MSLFIKKNCNMDTPKTSPKSRHPDSRATHVDVTQMDSQLQHLL